MTRARELDLDVIGPWTELKLEILRKYAKAYSTILNSQKKPDFHHVYIDAFAGAGHHVSKNSGEIVPGSPLNALEVEPGFREYHFIDLKDAKVIELERIAGERPDVYVHHGDCNEILLSEIFPKVRYEDYRRGLCVLDPYGLHLSWNVIRRAAESKTIEIFLNLPIHDINRNVLKKDRNAIDPRQAARLTALWGDETWIDMAYQKAGLFGWDYKVSNDALAEGFRKRLKTAGFEFVPKPIPMKNQRNAVVFFLYFASHNETGARIAREIFKKHSTGRA